jgi:hypothetical protein
VDYNTNVSTVWSVEDAEREDMLGEDEEEDEYDGGDELVSIGISQRHCDGPLMLDYDADFTVAT